MSGMKMRQWKDQQIAITNNNNKKDKRFAGYCQVLRHPASNAVLCLKAICKSE